MIIHLNHLSPFTYQQEMEQDFNIHLISGIFIVAGILHFIFPKVYLRIMPRYIPYPEAMVFWSGVFEILGGAGFFFTFSRAFSAYGLILLLVAVFPANIDMFRQAYKKRGVTLFTLATLLRLPVQFWLMFWIYASAGLM